MTNASEGSGSPPQGGGGETSDTSDGNGRTGASRAALWIVCAAVIAVSLFVLWRGVIGPGDRADAARPTPAGAVTLVLEPGAEQQESSPQLRVAGDLDGVVIVQSGDVIHVDADRLSVLPEVAFELDLVEPSADGAPRPVRLYKNGRVLAELETAPLEGDLRRARVAIPSTSLLEPARYIVEVRTTESSHFPIRRFAIEIH